MKLTINYIKKIIKEELLKEVQALDNLKLAQQANQEFKKLYIIVRNEILKYKQHYIITFPNNIENGKLKPEINKVSFSSAMRSYKPTENFTLVTRDLVFTKAQEFKILKLQVNDDPFKLTFLNDESIGADIVADESGLSRIRFNPIFLFDDEQQFKSMLQHELQHIIDYSTEMSSGIDRDGSEEEYWRSVIKYLSVSHEIGAHARQAAYIYHSSYRQDQEIDLNKLLTINNKMLKTFNAYIIKFNKKFIDKELPFLTEEEKNKAIKANETFVYLLKEYFKLYKNS